VAVASVALTRAWGSATRGQRQVQVVAELDRAKTEIALLREELNIKDARWSRVPPRQRPHYSPIQRMWILELKAARGWTASQVAEVFAVTEETIDSWLKRVDEEGEHALVQITEPVNKFPVFVRYLVRHLKTLCPTMGKIRIAQALARAGLHLGATTMGRILKDTEPVPEDVAGAVDVIETRHVTARHPGHVWHVDLTVVPPGTGFWVPWLPFALPQSWPFCWWVAVVVDHFSRSVVGFAVFFGPPTASEMQRSLSRAIHRVGHPPNYIISDKGRQFWCKSFKRWCRRRGISPRFGAVGKHGSIANVERFIRSMKNECTCRILVPLRLAAMRRELRLYAVWYNEHRPSQALGGRTPWEVYVGLRPANARSRFEPRGNWPARGPCASPQTTIRGKPGTKLSLVVGYVEGRQHLPVVELRQAA
jgi:transposase InsO family protein